MFPVSARLSFTRQELISGVVIICFFNGISEQVFRGVHVLGIWPASSAVFGISIFVIACLYLAIENVFDQAPCQPTRSDALFFLTIVVITAIPDPSASWIALTIVGVRERLRSSAKTAQRRSAVLLIALAFPMFWSRLFFTLLSEVILKGDAFLVATVIGAHRFGNAVSLPDGGGFLWIASPCSSLANVSLAVLCWLMFTEYSGRDRSIGDYVVCICACFNVVLINVARICIMALRPDLYEIVHGPFGATVAGYATTLVVLTVCVMGVRRGGVASGEVQLGFVGGFRPRRN